MALVPDSVHNFMQGLSDFWAVWFKDLSTFKALHRGMQIEVGQAYLDLLQEVLGVSMEHAPLFDRKYFRLFRIREDEVAFIEGENAAADRYAFFEGEVVAGVPVLSNRAILPTSILENMRDYDVTGGQILFHLDPFNQDGLGTTLPNFPIRTVSAEFPSTCRHPQNISWATLGARSGDLLTLQVARDRPVASLIRFVDGTSLRLATLADEHRLDLRTRSLLLTVLRTPFDREKRGIVTPGQARGFVNAAATPVAATSTVTTILAGPTWVGMYLYIEDQAVPTNGGFYRVNAVVPGVSATLDRFTPFLPSAGPFVTLLVDFGPDTGSPSPTFAYAQTNIDRDSLTVSGRRAVDRGAAYPAGEAVVEGIDFAIDYEAGTITYLSPWDSTVLSHSTFTWRLRIAQVVQTFRNNPTLGDLPGGVWVPGNVYFPGDVVQQPAGSGKYYVALVVSADIVFDVTKWRVHTGIFFLDETTDVREIAMWGTDALLDRERLYTTFGYLLGFKKPSSEQYRAFLRGVAQLFLLGPTLERFESALNVTAGFPVVRDDDEILQNYVSAYEVVSSLPDTRQGAGGHLFDSSYGRDGTLTSFTSTFSSPNIALLASDVGAIIEVGLGAAVQTFAIVSVISSIVAEVSPVPLDAVNQPWRFRHATVNRRFVTEAASTTHLFSADDVDGAIVIEDADNPSNIGSFRIVAVEDPRTVVLASDFPFIDESGISWRLTRTRVQQVVTDRATYKLPHNAPVRADVQDPTNFTRLTFHGFEPLTTAITVVDYVRDPTWWRNITIPREVLTLEEEDPGRRVVAPQIIPNTFNPLDRARFGDPGLLFGADDEGRPGIARMGPAMWMGDGWIRLDFVSPTPEARLTDVNTYLTVLEGPRVGHYQILEIQPGGGFVRVDRFPTPEAIAGGHVPPEVLSSVKLAPISLRRTVPFVMMDRFLQYHALQIRVESRGSLTPEFIDDATGLLNAAKPGFVFIYLNPNTSFRDELRLSDLLEITFGPDWRERIFFIDNQLYFTTDVLFGEFHKYMSSFQAGVQGAPGPLAFTITPVFPYVPDRHRFVFARFSSGTAAGKPLCEGVHYTINYATGAVSAPLVDAGPWQIDYAVCMLKVHAAASPWWTVGGLFPGETPHAFGGPDSLIRLAAGQLLDDLGFVDRAIDITIGP